ncbi:MAG: hypothetical protein EXS50_01080 [Candidatus Taylorbacteria bacterium]|nr:hypothetical protein [Candidatus Taylorbacteria bacterium]
MAIERKIPTLAGKIVSYQHCLETLSDDNAQWVIENTEEAIVLFVDAVKNRGKQVVEKTVETIKRILTARRSTKVGAMTADELIEAIEEVKEGKEKNEISNEARFILKKTALAEKLGQIDHIILTPADLGFTLIPHTDAFMTKKFCAEWSAKHLEGCVIELCEPEDGPQLRLQYQDQSKDEVLWIAMDRITDSDGNPSVFCVGRYGDGDRWLNAPLASESDRWDLGNRVVFRLRNVLLPLAP